MFVWSRIRCFWAVYDLFCLFLCACVADILLLYPIFCHFMCCFILFLPGLFDPFQFFITLLLHSLPTINLAAFLRLNREMSQLWVGALSTMIFFHFLFCLSPYISLSYSDSLSVIPDNNNNTRAKRQHRREEKTRSHTSVDSLWLGLALVTQTPSLFLPLSVLLLLPTLTPMLSPKRNVRGHPCLGLAPGLQVQRECVVCSHLCTVFLVTLVWGQGFRQIALQNDNDMMATLGGIKRWVFLPFLVWLPITFPAAPRLSGAMPPLCAGECFILRLFFCLLTICGVFATDGHTDVFAFTLRLATRITFRCQVSLECVAR